MKRGELCPRCRAGKIKQSRDGYYCSNCHQEFARYGAQRYSA